MRIRSLFLALALGLMLWACGAGAQTTQRSDVASGTARGDVGAGAPRGDVFGVFGGGGGGPSIPATPTGVTVLTGSQSVLNISWTASAGAASYTVQQSATGTGGWSTIGTPVSTSQSATGLATATTYYFQVSATNSAGTSAYSSVANGTTETTPGPSSAAPTVTALTAPFSPNTTSMNAVTANAAGYVAVTGLGHVAISANSGTSWSLLADIPAVGDASNIATCIALNDLNQPVVATGATTNGNPHQWVEGYIFVYQSGAWVQATGYNNAHVPQSMTTDADGTSLIMVDKWNADFWKSTTHGTSWTKVFSNCTVSEGGTALGVALFPDNSIWVVGESLSGIVTSTNDGVSWTGVTIPYRDVNIFGITANSLIEPVVGSVEGRTDPITGQPNPPVQRLHSGTWYAATGLPSYGAPNWLATVSDGGVYCNVGAKLYRSVDAAKVIPNFNPSFNSLLGYFPANTATLGAFMCTSTNKIYIIGASTVSPNPFTLYQITPP